MIRGVLPHSQVPGGRLPCPPGLPSRSAEQGRSSGPFVGHSVLLIRPPSMRRRARGCVPAQTDVALLKGGSPRIRCRGRRYGLAPGAGAPSPARYSHPGASCSYIVQLGPQASSRGGRALSGGGELAGWGRVGPGRAGRGWRQDMRWAEKQRLSGGGGVSTTGDGIPARAHALAEGGQPGTACPAGRARAHARAPAVARACCGRSLITASDHAMVRHRMILRTCAADGRRHDACAQAQPHSPFICARAIHARSRARAHARARACTPRVRARRTTSSPPVGPSLSGPGAASLQPRARPPRMSLCAGPMYVSMYGICLSVWGPQAPCPTSPIGETHVPQRAGDADEVSDPPPLGAHTACSGAGGSMCKACGRRQTPRARCAAPRRRARRPASRPAGKPRDLPGRMPAEVTPEVTSIPRSVSERTRGGGSASGSAIECFMPSGSTRGRPPPRVPGLVSPGRSRAGHES